MLVQPVISSEPGGSGQSLSLARRRERVISGICRVERNNASGDERLLNRGSRLMTVCTRRQYASRKIANARPNVELPRLSTCRYTPMREPCGCFNGSALAGNFLPRAGRRFSVSRASGGDAGWGRTGAGQASVRPLLRPVPRSGCKRERPAAPALKAAPTDLTRLQGRAERFPRSRVRDIIDGERIVNAHGSRTMPVWGRVLRDGGDYGQTQDAILLIVQYLESLQAAPRDPGSR